MSWRKTYSGYSIGCAVVWAVILSVVAVVYPNRLQTFLFDRRRVVDRMDFSDDCTVGLSAAQTEAPRDVGPVGDLNITASLGQKTG